MKSIVLTGMMGSGKTSVGKILAQYLDFDYVDVDDEIEKRESKSISEIFEQDGEEYFRHIEAKIIKELIKDNCVVALGGGAFEDFNTREFLLKNSTIVYLQTSAKWIYKRIKNDSQRPLLKDNMSIDKIDEIINLRKNNYEKAHIVINTDNKNINQVAEEIQQWL